jgi:hypothetical protein
MRRIRMFERGVTASAPWRASALPDFRLRVRFVDGTEGEVYMAGFLRRQQVGVFAPLRDPAVFAQASVEFGAVTWPSDLDLAPDAMYDAIRKTGKQVPLFARQDEEIAQGERLS